MGCVRKRCAHSLHLPHPATHPPCASYERGSKKRGLDTEGREKALLTCRGLAGLDRLQRAATNVLEGAVVAKMAGAACCKVSAHVRPLLAPTHLRRLCARRRTDAHSLPQRWGCEDKEKAAATTARPPRLWLQNKSGFGKRDKTWIKFSIS